MVIKNKDYAVLATGAAEVAEKFRITPLSSTTDSVLNLNKDIKVRSKPLKKLSHAPRPCSAAASMNKQAPFKYWRG